MSIRRHLSSLLVSILPDAAWDAIDSGVAAVIRDGRAREDALERLAEKLLVQERIYIDDNASLLARAEEAEELVENERARVNAMGEQRGKALARAEKAEAELEKLRPAAAAWAATQDVARATARIDRAARASGHHSEPVDPECPGEDCKMCNGEACNLCGAGCWSRPGDIPPCEHSVDERHMEAADARPDGELVGDVDPADACCEFCGEPAVDDGERANPIVMLDDGTGKLGPFHAGCHEETMKMLAMRKALGIEPVTVEEAHERFIEAITPRAPMPKPTPEDVRAFGRAFEAAGEWMPSPSREQRIDTALRACLSAGPQRWFTISIALTQAMGSRVSQDEWDASAKRIGAEWDVAGKLCSLPAVESPHCPPVVSPASAAAIEDIKAAGLVKLKGMSLADCFRGSGLDVEIALTALANEGAKLVDTTTPAHRALATCDVIACQVHGRSESEPS